MTIDKMIGYLDYTQAHRATHFISEKEIVRVTRRLVGGKIEKNGRTRDYSVTIGKPNYEEREFLNAAKKVGEPFPVKKRK